MKIAQINMIPYGSTGKIMLQIAQAARKCDHEARTYSTVPFDRKKENKRVEIENHFYWGNRFENMIHYYLGSVSGYNGCFSQAGTKELISYLKKFNPDIIHLHNLHKFCINIPMLFNYITSSKVHVIWTLHDCWSFTGHCPHFTMVKCNKWKTGCHHCDQINAYPKSYIDNTKNMWKLKKKWFTGINEMTIVTPSQWLADLVKESYLNDYPVKVINNGIDLSVFRPMESSFREKYSCRNKTILLGVAFGWGKRKGIDVFIELSKRLDSKYQIVLIGTDENVDKQLPSNIISIHKTQNQADLAEIYTTADLFVNPTREEVLGMVNVECLACGTPVLTFRTGGSPECLDETCGSVVDCDDIDAMEKEIIRINKERPYSSESCIARAKRFDMNDKFKEYVKIYEDSAHLLKRTV